MKVLAITASAELGGTERVLIDLARETGKHGIVLTVVVPRSGPLVEILRDQCQVLVVPAPAAMLAGSQRGLALLKAPLALAAIPTWARRIARDAAPGQELVYATGFKPYLAAAWLGLKPIVWHLHEHPPRTSGPVWFRLARSPAAILANSSSTAEAWTRGRKHLAEKTQVIPNGVDLTAFHPRARTYRTHDELGLAHDAVLIGMPAVLARWKGHLEVVEAFRKIAANHPDTHLVLVGGSIYDTEAERSYESELTAMLAGKGLGRVHRLSFKPDIEGYLTDFDLMVHYSTRPEAFGRVVVEAMASGVPVIAAAEGGPLEILGGTGPGLATGGWLCEPRDPAVLARMMGEALCQDGGRLRELGLAGRQRAERLFSATAFGEKLAAALLAVKG